MKEKKIEFTLYKIYSENCLLYLGRTKQPLQTRLHGHYFKAPMHRSVNIECVTKVEYATFSSEADMYLYEIYYINKLKPVLNRDDKAKDKLTVELPEVAFVEYLCPLMDKWKEQIRVADEHDARKRKMKAQLEMEKIEKRKDLAALTNITPEERLELWETWLENYYEPARNSLL